MAEFQINNEDLTGLKGKVVIITGMSDPHIPLISGNVANRGIRVTPQTNQ